MLNLFTQILSLTHTNLKALAQRRAAAAVILVGIAGVVAVLIGLLSMSAGYQNALRESGHPNRALLLRNGATDEITSWFVQEELNVLRQLDGIATISPELYIALDLPNSSTNRTSVAVGRGVTPAALALREEFEIVAGREFNPGQFEILVGADAVGTYAGLALGSNIRLRDHDYRVVGHFRSNSAHDSELWLDLSAAQGTFRRGGSVSSARIWLEKPNNLNQLQAAIEQSPALKAQLTSEQAFYAEQSQGRAQLIESFAYLISGIMALGAIIAALNTMYGAISAHVKEIATLRALGFAASAILVSLLVEAMLLASLGGVLGAGLVYMVFDGYSASTLNNSSLSQVAFLFAVTQELVLTGLVWALSLGFLGGLMPALRAAGIPIVAGLRGR